MRHFMGGLLVFDHLVVLVKETDLAELLVKMMLIFHEAIQLHCHQLQISLSRQICSGAIQGEVKLRFIAEDSLVLGPVDGNLLEDG